MMSVGALTNLGLTAGYVQLSEISEHNIYSNCKRTELGHYRENTYHASKNVQPTLVIVTPLKATPLATLTSNLDPNRQNYSISLHLRPHSVFAVASFQATFGVTITGVYCTTFSTILLQYSKQGY